ncbi:hypothetical protein ACIP10_34895 [Streptomyces galbus]|uniref:hypothetical protein n=1 Tax=Streptomyces galbus TaxID=33898 RepID=UPI0037F54A75
MFRPDAVYNYVPAWAQDRSLGAPFKFATERQLTGYVLGRMWQGRALKARHAASPFVTAQDFRERPWQVGYVRSARVRTDVRDRAGGEVGAVPVGAVDQQVEPVGVHGAALVQTCSSPAVS